MPPAARVQRQGRVQDVDDDKRGEPGVRGHFSGTCTNFKTKPGNGGVRVLVAHVDGRYSAVILALVVLIFALAARLAPPLACPARW